MEKLKRVPYHVGIIPDGNRRFAVKNNMNKEDGYAYGVTMGVKACKELIELGVREVTFYGFTKDNAKREKVQKDAFTKACVDAVHEIDKVENVCVNVVGDTTSKAFPQELLKYIDNDTECDLKVNLLVNYDWKWDIDEKPIKSDRIPRMELIIRWGGQRRLSGFLPVQSVYSDIYIIDNYWGDYEDHDIKNALVWYQNCDVTLGG